MDNFYIDDGYSGVDYRRPAFEKLIEELKLKKSNILITKDISRLGREYIDTCKYIYEIFPSLGVKYIAIDDNFIINNDYLTKIKAIINDKYIKDISKKISYTKNVKKQNGEYKSAYSPYGYKKCVVNNKATLVIDENVCNIIKYIFRSVANGSSIKEVCNSLNSKHIDTPSKYLKKYKTNLKWTYNIIYRIINNPIYIGNIEYQKTKKINYNMKRRSYIKPKERKVMVNTHEAIITKEEFDIVNVNIKRRKSKNQKVDINPKLYCGNCGKKLKLIERSDIKKLSIYAICYLCKKKKSIAKLTNEINIYLNKNFSKEYINFYLYINYIENYLKYVDISVKIRSNIYNKIYTNYLESKELITYKKTLVYSKRQYRKVIKNKIDINFEINKYMNEKENIKNLIEKIVVDKQTIIFFNL